MNLSAHRSFIDTTNQSQQSMFYDGRFYDLIFASSYRHAIQAQDLNFWRVIAQQYGPSVLELGCGTGRIAANLASENIRVTGLEISISMLKAAQSKSSLVEWVHADVCQFSLQSRYSLIIFPYDTFTHLHTKDEVRQCLGCIANHLEPGGHFIIDLKNPYYVGEILRQPDRVDPYSKFCHPDTGSEIVVQRKRFYDPFSQIHAMKLIFSEHGKFLSEDVLSLRIYYPQEIIALLSENRFRVDQIWGNYQFDPYGVSSSHLLLDCQLMI